eukprot:TRINITY_DN3090_c2_g2_i3.p1 TRINITY_DN3090_c2_g2~~TRINITY_DN3090_c2_g2_i3.p1  ORF type:complete len:1113 (-),score=70.56 TRINITY_DN3090_c2_g2_i3:669-4007(-)
MNILSVVTRCNSIKTKSLPYLETLILGEKSSEGKFLNIDFVSNKTLFLTRTSSPILAKAKFKSKGFVDDQFLKEYNLKDSDGKEYTIETLILIKLELEHKNMSNLKRKFIYRQRLVQYLAKDGISLLYKDLSSLQENKNLDILSFVKIIKKLISVGYLYVKNEFSEKISKPVSKTIFSRSKNITRHLLKISNENTDPFVDQNNLQVVTNSVTSLLSEVHAKRKKRIMTRVYASGSLNDFTKVLYKNLGRDFIEGISNHKVTNEAKSISETIKIATNLTYFFNSGIILHFSLNQRKVIASFSNNTQVFNIIEENAKHILEDFTTIKNITAKSAFSNDSDFTINYPFRQNLIDAVNKGKLPEIQSIVHDKNTGNTTLSKIVDKLPALNFDEIKTITEFTNKTQPEIGTVYEVVVSVINEDGSIVDKTLSIPNESTAKLTQSIDFKNSTKIMTESEVKRYDSRENYQLVSYLGVPDFLRRFYNKISNVTVYFEGSNFNAVTFAVGLNRGLNVQGFDPSNINRYLIEYLSNNDNFEKELAEYPSYKEYLDSILTKPKPEVLLNFKFKNENENYYLPSNVFNFILTHSALLLSEKPLKEPLLFNHKTFNRFRNGDLKLTTNLFENLTSDKIYGSGLVKQDLPGFVKFGHVFEDMSSDPILVNNENLRIIETDSITDPSYNIYLKSLGLTPVETVQGILVEPEVVAKDLDLSLTKTERVVLVQSDPQFEEEIEIESEEESDEESDDEFEEESEVDYSIDEESLTKLRDFLLTLGLNVSEDDTILYSDINNMTEKLHLSELNSFAIYLIQVKYLKLDQDLSKENIIDSFKNFNLIKPILVDQYSAFDECKNFNSITDFVLFEAQLEDKAKTEISPKFQGQIEVGNKILTSNENLSKNKNKFSDKIHQYKGNAMEDMSESQLKSVFTFKSISEVIDKELSFVENTPGIYVGKSDAFRIIISLANKFNVNPNFMFAVVCSALLMGACAEAATDSIKISINNLKGDLIKIRRSDIFTQLRYYVPNAKMRSLAYALLDECIEVSFKLYAQSKCAPGTYAPNLYNKAPEDLRNNPDYAPWLFDFATKSARCPKEVSDWIYSHLKQVQDRNDSRTSYENRRIQLN